MRRKVDVRLSIKPRIIALARSDMRVGKRGLSRKVEELLMKEYLPEEHNHS